MTRAKIEYDSISGVKRTIHSLRTWRSQYFRPQLLVCDVCGFEVETTATFT
jgi:hypothetical protein